MSEYKLCRVDSVQSMWVRPIDNKGTDLGNTLLEREEDGFYYYAIYEKIEDDDWEEWGYYDQDLDKAVEEYNKLTKGDG